MNPSRHIDKSSFGFTLDLPEEWTEQPPSRELRLGRQASVGVAEVASFGTDDGAVRCRVFHHTSRIGEARAEEHARQAAGLIARMMRPSAAATISHTGTRFADRAAFVLEADPVEGEPGLRYFVAAAETEIWVLAFATHCLDENRGLFDRVAATFAVTDTDRQIGPALEPVADGALAIAESLGHASADASHVLLAILEQESSTANLVLREHGVMPDDVRRTLAEARSPTPKTAEARLTGPTLILLRDVAPAIALTIGDEEPAPEHALLALLALEPDVLAKLTAPAELDLAAVRHRLLGSRCSG